MTYVIAEPCVDVMDQACVAVCPSTASISSRAQIAPSTSTRTSASTAARASRSARSTRSTRRSRCRLAGRVTRSSTRCGSRQGRRARHARDAEARLTLRPPEGRSPSAPVRRRPACRPAAPPTTGPDPGGRSFRPRSTMRIVSLLPAATEIVSRWDSRMTSWASRTRARSRTPPTVASSRGPRTPAPVRIRAPGGGRRAGGGASARSDPRAGAMEPGTCPDARPG